MVGWQRLPGLNPPRKGVGLGLFRNKYPGGTELWGHGGAWGVAMFYEPASDTYLSGSVNQIFGVPENWLEQLFLALRTE
jgi:hypothetical protein